MLDVVPILVNIQHVLKVWKRYMSQEIQYETQNWKICVHCYQKNYFTISNLIFSNLYHLKTKTSRAMHLEWKKIDLVPTLIRGKRQLREVTGGRLSLVTFENPFKVLKRYILIYVFIWSILLIMFPFFKVHER